MFNQLLADGPVGYPAGKPTPPLTSADRQALWLWHGRTVARLLRAGYDEDRAETLAGFILAVKYPGLSGEEFLDITH